MNSFISMLIALILYHTFVNTAIWDDILREKVKDLETRLLILVIKRKKINDILYYKMDEHDEEADRDYVKILRVDPLGYRIISCEQDGTVKVNTFSSKDGYDTSFTSVHFNMILTKKSQIINTFDSELDNILK